MIQQHSGHLVVVSSLTGKLPVPGRSAYCASKHALHGFFDALRGEVFQYGIKVTIVCPGFVQTKISENSLLADGTKRGGKTDKEHRWSLTPEESAKHILYAIRTGKEEYDYGSPEKWAVPIRRWLPWLYSRAIRRIRLSA
jgi:dehydrogenase/reductase SDR family protein 7B